MEAWRNGGISAGALPGCGMLGERGDHQHAERPEVGGGREQSAGDFGCVVLGGAGGTGVGLAGAADLVDGELELVVDDEEVGGFERGVGQLAAVQVGERGEDRGEQFAGLGGRKCALGEDFREQLVGVLGDGVEAIHAVDGAAAEGEEADEIGMRERLRGGPEAEPRVGVDRLGADELDGGGSRGVAVDLGEEDTGAPGSAEPAEKGKAAVDDDADVLADWERGAHVGFRCAADEMPHILNHNMFQPKTLWRGSAADFSDSGPGGQRLPPEKAETRLQFDS